MKHEIIVIKKQTNYTNSPKRQWYYKVVDIQGFVSEEQYMDICNECEAKAKAESGCYVVDTIVDHWNGKGTISQFLHSRVQTRHKKFNYKPKTI